jgi:hypothetical protein
VHVLLDLKGIDRRLAAAVGRVIEREARGPVTVCSRTWSHLDRLGGEPAIARVHSVGNRLQLRALRRRRLHDGVAVNARLLDGRAAAELRERVPLLLSWPVRTLADARRLVAHGVNGLIADDLALLAAARGSAWAR